MALIILQQILTMALYMICGYLLYKSGKITDEGSKSIANLLPWVIIPSTLINSFLTDYSAEKMRELLISFGMAALTLLIAMIIGILFFRNSGIECFAASFSNAGFIGIPLVQATVGSEGVFYLSGMLFLLKPAVGRLPKGIRIIISGGWTNLISVIYYAAVLIAVLI